MLFVALLGKVIVFSPYPLLPDDFPHAVEESPVPWVGGPLIVDELDLNGLHGGDGEDCLAHSGAQPAQQSCAGREHAVVVSHVLLEELEGSESDSWLGDGSVDEDGEAAVESERAALPHSLLGAVRDSLVAANLLVQLQLRLDILGRVGDADLDAAGDAASDDALKELVEEERRESQTIK